MKFSNFRELNKELVRKLINKNIIQKNIMLVGKYDEI